MKLSGLGAGLNPLTAQQIVGAGLGDTMKAPLSHEEAMSVFKKLLTFQEGGADDEKVDYPKLLGAYEGASNCFEQFFNGILDVAGDGSQANLTVCCARVFACGRCAAFTYCGHWEYLSSLDTGTWPFHSQACIHCWKVLSCPGPQTST